MSRQKYLFMGAHPDDIEIGCLGTIFSLDKTIDIDFVVCSSTNIRREEFEKSIANLKSQKVMISKAICYSFPDGELPVHKYELKKKIKSDFNYYYDKVFTHYRNDLHQDHRVVAELSLELYRNSEIFAYEIPKYDGCSFIPSAYRQLTEEVMNKKLEHLSNEFISQHVKRWYRAATFQSLATIRGIEINSEYAEAFIPIKIKI